MRTMTSRYAWTCQGCGHEGAVGDLIAYERGCGAYCPGCAPTGDALRDARNDARTRKAERYEGWAEARQRRADTHQARSDSLMQRDANGRADWALVTQPGYIPQRAQANRAQERAWREAAAAGAHRARADALRAPALVAGDTERSREARREPLRQKAREWVRKGLMVYGDPYPEPLEVVRVNRKTATLRGRVAGFFPRVDLADIRPVA